MFICLLTILTAFGTHFDQEAFENYVKAGEECLQEGNYCRAVQEFSTAVLMMEWSGHFSNLSAYNQRGNIYFVIGDYPSAIEDYTCVVDRAENQPQEMIHALRGRCFSYGLLGDAENCNADFIRIGALLSQDGFDEEYRIFIQSLEILSLHVLSELDYREEGEWEWDPEAAPSVIDVRQVKKLSGAQNGG